MAEVQCCIWSCKSDKSTKGIMLKLIPNEWNDAVMYVKWKEEILQHHASLIHLVKNFDIELPVSLLFPVHSPLFVCSLHFESDVLEEEKDRNDISESNRIPTKFIEEDFDKKQVLSNIHRHFQTIRELYADVAQNDYFNLLWKALKIPDIKNIDPAVEAVWRKWETKTRNILFYIQKGSLPSNISLTPQEQEALIEEAFRYYIEDGLLFYGRSKKVVTTLDQREEVFKELKIEGGACDEEELQKMIDDIKSRYHWPSLEQDIKEEVSRLKLVHETEAKEKKESDSEFVLDESEGTFGKKKALESLEELFEKVRGAAAREGQGDGGSNEISSCLSLVNTLMYDEDCYEIIGPDDESPVVNSSSGSSNTTITSSLTVSSKASVNNLSKTDPARNLKISPKIFSAIRSEQAGVLNTESAGASQQVKHKSQQLRPMASMLFDLGRNLVRQQVCKDLIDDYLTEELVENKLLHETELKKLQENYEGLKKRNAVYRKGYLKCGCGYEAGSTHALQLHYDYGGYNDTSFECCICTSMGWSFSTKFPSQFSIHMINKHLRVAKQYCPPAFYTCPYCPFEHRHNSKAKLQRHHDMCRGAFNINFNLLPTRMDSDIPPYPNAITSKPSKPVTTTTNSTTTDSATSTNVVAKNDNVKTVQMKSGKSLVVCDMCGGFLADTAAFEKHMLIAHKIVYNASKEPITSTNKPNTTSPATESPASTSVITKNTTPAKSIAVKPPSQSTVVCEICGGFVGNYSSLGKHFLVAHKVALPPSFSLSSQPHLPCLHCSERYWTPIGLANHVKHFHSTDKPATTVDSSRCVLCQRTRVSDPVVHLSTSHRITPRDMLLFRFCAICGIELHTMRAFEDHMTLQHNKYFPDRASIHKYIPDVVLSDGPKPCLRMDANNTAKVAGKKVPPLASVLQSTGRSGKPDIRAPDANLVNRKVSKCPICNEHIWPAWSEDLWKHLEEKHAKRCGHCDKKFIVDENLDEHVRVVHMSRKIVCTVCKIEISAGSEYTQHFLDKHMQKCLVTDNSNDRVVSPSNNKENVSEEPDTDSCEENDQQDVSNKQQENSTTSEVKNSEGNETQPDDNKDNTNEITDVKDNEKVKDKTDKKDKIAGATKDNTVKDNADVISGAIKDSTADKSACLDNAESGADKNKDGGACKQLAADNVIRIEEDSREGIGKDHDEAKQLPLDGNSIIGKDSSVGDQELDLKTGSVENVKKSGVSDIKTGECSVENMEAVDQSEKESHPVACKSGKQNAVKTSVIRDYDEIEISSDDDDDGQQPIKKFKPS